MGGSKAGGLPHFSLSRFPPLPLSIAPTSFPYQWEGTSDSVRGEVPRLPPLQLPPCPFNHCTNCTNVSRGLSATAEFLVKVPVDVDLANSRVKFRTEILSGCWGKQLILEDCHLEDTTIIFNFIILTVVDDHRDIRSINHQHAKHERITK